MEKKHTFVKLTDESVMRCITRPKTHNYINCNKIVGTRDIAECLNGVLVRTNSKFIKKIVNKLMSRQHIEAHQIFFLWVDLSTEYRLNIVKGDFALRHNIDSLYLYMKTNFGLDQEIGDEEYRYLADNGFKFVNRPVFVGFVYEHSCLYRAYLQ